MPTNDNANAVERAVRAVGGPTKASHVCAVSAYAVYKWRRAGAVPDARSALLLAAASGIPAWELAGLAADPDATAPKRAHRAGVDFQKKSGARGAALRRRGTRVKAIDQGRAALGEVAGVAHRQARVAVVQRPLHVRQRRVTAQ